MLDYVANEFDRALYRTLVVGGEPSVLRKLTPRLRRHLLKVDGHWPWKKQAGAFPDTIEVLFVLTDMVSHSLSGLAIEEARKRGIPVIMGGRKHALNVERLASAGFPEVPMLAPKPAVSPKRQKTEASVSDASVSDASVSDAPMPVFPVPVAPTPVEVLSPPVLAAAVEPTVPEITPEETPVPNPRTLLKTRSLAAPTSVVAIALPTMLKTGTGRAVLLALAADPGVSNVKMMETFGLGSSQGTVATTGVEARRVLGIVSPRTPAPVVTVDAVTYNKVCAYLGVTPVALPPNGEWPRTQKKMGRAALGEREDRKVGKLRLSPTVEVEVHRKPPSFSTVATVPASEVPAPVRAAYEREEQHRREEATTTVEALRLLLEAMRAENVSHVSIRDDGTVSMERRVVVSSSITL
jgi:hypothetical protein